MEWKKLIQTHWEFSSQMDRQTTVAEVSVTRLGYFWQFLATNFPSKSSPNIWKLFGLLWKAWHISISYHGYCLGKFCEKIGLLFIPTSGHTSCCRVGRMVQMLHQKITAFIQSSSIIIKHLLIQNAEKIGQIKTVSKLAKKFLVEKLKSIVV